MICPHCVSEIEREYPNIYGTLCPHCGRHIAGEKEPEFVSDNKLKLKLFQATARQMLRERLEKEKDGRT